VVEVRYSNKRQTRQIQELKGDLRKYEYEMDLLSKSQNERSDEYIERMNRRRLLEEGIFVDDFDHLAQSVQETVRDDPKSKREYVKKQEEIRGRIEELQAYLLSSRTKVDLELEKDENERDFLLKAALFDKPSLNNSMNAPIRSKNEYTPNQRKSFASETDQSMLGLQLHKKKEHQAPMLSTTFRNTVAHFGDIEEKQPISVKNYSQTNFRSKNSRVSLQDADNDKFPIEKSQNTSINGIRQDTYDSNKGEEFEQFKQRRHQMRENIEQRIRNLNDTIQSDINKAKNLLVHY